MSKSLMHDLYFGNLTPWERGRVQGQGYSSLGDKVSDLITRFQELLSPEEFEKFEEIEDLQAQMGAIEEVDLFQYAFCLGALIVTEVSDFKEKRLTELKNE